MMKGKSRYAGIVLTAAVHAVLLVLLLSTDISSTPPAPPVDGMLIEFTEEDTPETVEEKPVPIRTAVGVEPKAAEADPTEDIRLVQKSEAQAVAEAENINAEATVGEDGDVEIPEPPREKPVNRRALFPGMGEEKDSTALHVAEKITERLSAGHPEGNTVEGNPEGMPTARLEGRTVMGNLPLPEYDVVKSDQRRSGRTGHHSPGRYPVGGRQAGRPEGQVQHQRLGPCRTGRHYLLHIHFEIVIRSAGTLSDPAPPPCGPAHTPTICPPAYT